MATPHNAAEPGEIAKTVLMPGDPLRARFIAETYLDNIRLVSSVRNVYAYTGTYKGTPVSVMASGMGMPSIGIYSYELYSQYGVENIIRIGSAGSYVEELHVYDVVLADSAYSGSSFAYVQNGCKDDIMYPSASLNQVIRETAQKLNTPLKLTRIHSSDVFYEEPGNGSFTRYVTDHGAKAVEMESFALFHNADVLGKNAACLLTISDSFVSDEETTAEERQTSFTVMMELALESAIQLVK